MFLFEYERKDGGDCSEQILFYSFDLFEIAFIY